MKGITDYFIYDRSKNKLLRFGNSANQIIFYGSKTEAVEDLYPNEEVLRFDQLPEDKKTEVLNQLNK